MWVCVKAHRFMDRGTIGVCGVWLCVGKICFDQWGCRKALLQYRGCGEIVCQCTNQELWHSQCKIYRSNSFSQDKAWSVSWKFATDFCCIHIVSDKSLPLKYRRWQLIGRHLCWKHISKKSLHSITWNVRKMLNDNRTTILHWALTPWSAAKS